MDMFNSNKENEDNILMERHNHSSPLSFYNQINTDSCKNECIEDPLKLLKEKASQLKNQFNLLHLNSLDYNYNDNDNIKASGALSLKEDNSQNEYHFSNEGIEEHEYQQDLAKEEIGLKCMQMIQSLNIKALSSKRMCPHDEEMSDSKRETENEREQSLLSNELIQNKELIYNRHIIELENQEESNNEEEKSFDKESKKNLLKIKLEAMLMTQQDNQEREELEENDRSNNKLDSIEVIEERPEENDLDSKTVTIDKDRLQVSTEKSKLINNEQDKEPFDSDKHIQYRINTTPSKSLLTYENTALGQHTSIDHYNNTEMQSMIVNTLGNKENINKTIEKDKDKDKEKTKETSVTNTDNFIKETVMTDNNQQHIDNNNCRTRNLPNRIPQIPFKSIKVTNCNEPINDRKRGSEDLIMLLNTIQKTEENKQKSTILQSKNDDTNKDKGVFIKKKEKSNEKIIEKNQVLIPKGQNKPREIKVLIIDKPQEMTSINELELKSKKNLNQLKNNPNETMSPIKCKSKPNLEINHTFKESKKTILKCETENKIIRSVNKSFDNDSITPKEKPIIHNKIAIKTKASKNHTQKKTASNTSISHKDKANPLQIVSNKMIDIKELTENNNSEIYSRLLTHDDIHPKMLNDKNKDNTNLNELIEVETCKDTKWLTSEENSKNNFKKINIPKLSLSPKDLNKKIINALKTDQIKGIEHHIEAERKQPLIKLENKTEKNKEKEKKIASGKESDNISTEKMNKKSAEIKQKKETEKNIVIEKTNTKGGKNNVDKLFEKKKEVEKKRLKEVENNGAPKNIASKRNILVEKYIQNEKNKLAEKRKKKENEKKKKREINTNKDQAENDIKSNKTDNQNVIDNNTKPQKQEIDEIIESNSLQNIMDDIQIPIVTDPNHNPQINPIHKGICGYHDITNLFSLELQSKNIILTISPYISKPIYFIPDTFNLRHWVKEKLNISMETYTTSKKLPIVIKKIFKNKIKHYHLFKNLNCYIQKKYPKENLFLLITKLYYKKFMINPIKLIFVSLKKSPITTNIITNRSYTSEKFIDICLSNSSRSDNDKSSNRSNLHKYLNAINQMTQIMNETKEFNKSNKTITDNAFHSFRNLD